MQNGYQELGNGKGEYDEPAEDGFNPHEVADKKEHKNTKTPVPKEFCTRAGVNNAPVTYTAADKSKKVIRHGEDGSTDANNDQYAKPMKKKKKGVWKKHGFS